MEAYNEVLLAKPFWRLGNNDSSLVARLLKAKYFSNVDIFNATIDPRSSFTWQVSWMLEMWLQVIRGGCWGTIVNSTFGTAGGFLGQKPSR